MMRPTRAARGEAFHATPPTTMHREARTNSITGVRCACAATMLPVLLLGMTAASAHRAACLHLLVTPITGPYLQGYACEGGRISGILCRACLFLGSTTALSLLAPATASSTLAVLWFSNTTTTTTSHDDANLAHYFYGGVWMPWAHTMASSALCLGCIQLLFILPKEDVLRVMGCTAVAVMVGALAIAAAVSPAALARRLFQASAPPFFVLFIETTRWRPPGRGESAANA